jgi:hypothetical protein
LPLAEKHKDEHVHDDGKCCECGDERHCCCDCPTFCDDSLRGSADVGEDYANPDVTKGRTWEETYPTETYPTTEEST